MTLGGNYKGRFTSNVKERTSRKPEASVEMLALEWGNPDILDLSFFGRRDERWKNKTISRHRRDTNAHILFRKIIDFTLTYFLGKNTHFYFQTSWKIPAFIAFSRKHPSG